MNIPTKGRIVMVANLTTTDDDWPGVISKIHRNDSDPQVNVFAFVDDWGKINHYMGLQIYATREDGVAAGAKHFVYWPART